MRVAILAVLGLVSGCLCEDLITQEFADELKRSVSWEVADPKENILRKLKKENFKRMLLNSLPVELRNLQDKNLTRNSKEDTVVRGEIRNLPAQFSWYDESRDCIHSGRDQGSECGSCWAFAIANHLSDRFCIWGKDVVLSVQHLLECDGRNKCCDGGTDVNAYKFLVEQGVVDEKCKPYDLQCHQCRAANCPRYKCKKDSAWYAADRADARREIFNNGPIQAIYDVYADFSNYKGGVYYHTKGEFLGVHTVEVLGWGRENGMDYWLCKNCWGDEWGMKSLFKIRMGECGIDDYMSSCLPDV